MRGVASLGGITIDTVQSAVGSYSAGLLGGNAAYGAWGASLWLDAGNTYLLGCVGGDFPTAWLAAMATAGIVTSGVEMIDEVTTAAWGAGYLDGERRVELESPAHEGARLSMSSPQRRVPTAGELEPHLRDTSLLAHLDAIHCAPVQPSVLLHNLSVLRQRQITVLVDPGEESAAWTDSTEAQVLSETDVYCPSLDDLPLSDRTDPAGAAIRLCDKGPATVAIKLGSLGSIVRSHGRSVFVPAAPAEVIDPTGAGDSYCGAFTAALVRFEDPFVAAVLASATASIAVEHSGLLDCLGVDNENVHRRASKVAYLAGLRLPTIA